MRVAIADDSALFRQGLSNLLCEEGIEVPIIAASGDELLARVRQDLPDVAILDIRMPPSHTNEGLIAARELRAVYPNLGILVLSVYAETNYAIQLLDFAKYGAGYLIKDRVNNVQELMAALHRICLGELVLDPKIVQRLLERTRATPTIARLTSREREVIQLMAEGFSNQRIADRLHVQVKTIERHIGSIFNNLDLDASRENNRRVLAVIAWLRRDS